MTTLAITDLDLNKDLDQQAMSTLTGGGSATLYTGTSYSAMSTSYSHTTSKQLQAYGWYQGKWAAWYSYKKVYKQTRNKYKSYQRIEWS